MSFPQSDRVRGAIGYTPARRDAGSAEGKAAWSRPSSTPDGRRHAQCLVADDGELEKMASSLRDARRIGDFAHLFLEKAENPLTLEFEGRTLRSIHVGHSRSGSDRRRSSSRWTGAFRRTGPGTRIPLFAPMPEAGRRPASVEPVVNAAIELHGYRVGRRSKWSRRWSWSYRRGLRPQVGRRNGRLAERRTEIRQRLRRGRSADVAGRPMDRLLRVGGHESPNLIPIPFLSGLVEPHMSFVTAGKRTHDPRRVDRARTGRRGVRRGEIPRRLRSTGLPGLRRLKRPRRRLGGLVGLGVARGPEPRPGRGPGLGGERGIILGRPGSWGRTGRSTGRSLGTRPAGYSGGSGCGRPSRRPSAAGGRRPSK